MTRWDLIPVVALAWAGAVLGYIFTIVLVLTVLPHSSLAAIPTGVGALLGAVTGLWIVRS